jgi:hypothetical protein
MGLFARLFGRRTKQATPIFADQAGEVDSAIDTSDNQSQDENFETRSQDTLHDTLRQALAPILTELQRTNERLNTMSAHSGGNNSRLGDSGTSETMQLAIEYALAHFFGLLKKRGAGIEVNPAILGRTADGNTALPFEPKLQYLLLVMNPLFPGLYSTQIILPSTFTKVDQLRQLPNGVQTKSLHIDTKKAPLGFVEAIESLQKNNADNLYLGMMDAPEGGDRHELRYYKCTGSELRNTAPDRFPDDLMLYFDTQSKPIVVQRRIPNVDEIFAPLHELEEGTPEWLSEDGMQNEQDQQ